MKPSKALQAFNGNKQALGEEAYKLLKGQLYDVECSISTMFEDGDAGRSASVPAAEAASLILEELRHLHPHNPLSSWTIEHQLEAIYAILAFDSGEFFESVSINFASDLPLEHFVRDFE